MNIHVCKVFDCCIVIATLACLMSCNACPTGKRFIYNNRMVIRCETSPCPTASGVTCESFSVYSWRVCCYDPAIFSNAENPGSGPTQVLPTQPINPGIPINPGNPNPVQPINPVLPVNPNPNPIQPVNPIPIQPQIPGQPGQGGIPGQPGQGGFPGQPGQGGIPGQPGQGGIPGQPGQGGFPGQPGQGGIPTPQPFPAPSGVCPGGGAPQGPCISSAVCPPNLSCQQGMCCSSTAGPIPPLIPGPTPFPPSPGAPSGGTCPRGDNPLGPCIIGNCPPNYSCSNGNCCASAPGRV